MDKRLITFGVLTLIAMAVALSGCTGGPAMDNKTATPTVEATLAATPTALANDTMYGNMNETVVGDTTDMKMHMNNTTMKNATDMGAYGNVTTGANNTTGMN